MSLGIHYITALVADDNSACYFLQWIIRVPWGLEHAAGECEAVGGLSQFVAAQGVKDLWVEQAGWHYLEGVVVVNVLALLVTVPHAVAFLDAVRYVLALDEGTDALFEALDLVHVAVDAVLDLEVLLCQYSVLLVDQAVEGLVDVGTAWGHLRVIFE